MFKHFIMLEWKAFLRSASLGTNIAMKIFIGFFAAYFMVIFIAAGVGVFFILKKSGLEPLSTVE